MDGEAENFCLQSAATIICFRTLNRPIEKIEVIQNKPSHKNQNGHIPIKNY